MAYRNKTYVCFDGDNDIHYYRLMQAWHQNDSSSFCFYNAHELNRSLDSSMESSIKRQLRERLLNTKIFVVLVGASTMYLTKFVRWEMEQALSLRLPIIAVNLNGIRQQDIARCPPLIRDELCMHISFNSKIMQHALENWPLQHFHFSTLGKTGPYYYGQSIYQKLGI